MFSVWLYPNRAALVWLALIFAIVPASASTAIDGSDAPLAQPRTLPVLLVAGRHRTTGDWFRTWPLVVTARLPERAAGAGAAPPLQLVVSLDGRPVPWPWQVTPAQGGVRRPTWTLAADELARQPAGDYTFELRAGDQVLGRTTLHLVVEPAASTPELVKQGLRARLAFAGAANDGTALQTLAAEYVARFPRDPDAHVAKGDALVQAGNDAEALQTYRHAIELWGTSIDPPEHILERYNAVLGRMAAQAQTRPAPPPTRNELQFFTYIDQGDAAVAKGNFAEAVRSYERAIRQQKNYQLTQDVSLIEEKLAEVRKRAEAAKPKPEGAK